MPEHPVPAERHVVLISRRWKSAEIRIDVMREGIQLGMPLAAFLDALVEEVGRPTLVLTKEQLRRRVHDAADAVCTEMKRNTARVM